ncbi:hypothetical protein GOX01_14830 [Gluconobacter oxydans]|nr:hypothetical protein GOX01_14830 [Gluconobacter oxydans]
MAAESECEGMDGEFVRRFGVEAVQERSDERSEIDHESFPYPNPRCDASASRVWLTPGVYLMAFCLGGGAGTR